MSASHLLDTATLLWAISAQDAIADGTHRKGAQKGTQARPGSVVEPSYPAAGIFRDSSAPPPRLKIVAAGTLDSDLTDRLLICQATAEGIPLVSRDPAMRQYCVDVAW